MKYVIVSSSEWTYPDFFDYATGSSSAELHAARNSYAACQILLKNIPDNSKINVDLKGEVSALDYQFYEMVPVFVEDNPNIPRDKPLPNFPNRWAPFYIYDCLKPLDKKIRSMDDTSALYFSVNISPDISPGKISGEIEISINEETIKIPVLVTIYKAIVPEEENIKIIIGFNIKKTADYHNVVFGSGEHQNINNKYLKMLRHMRQNMLFLDGKVKAQKNTRGIFDFDFSEMIDFVKNAISLGFKYFNAPKVGKRKSWKDSTILVGPNYEYEAMSYEGYSYLTQYLTQLSTVLKENSWIGRFYIEVLDEPNDANAMEFRALCGLVRKFAPDIKLLDAVSYGEIHGALDVWVPLNSEYDKHRDIYENYRNDGDEVWHYVCCAPRSEGYINRFLDYPLLSTRYLFWGNYRYSLSGYLHWAANVYQPDQDPFKTNCPYHVNADSKIMLPPGDTHIMYPGKDGPWMSMRLEAHRESAEEFELLRHVSLKDKALADGICLKGFRSFNDVEYDPNKFDNLKIELLKAASI